MQFLQNFTIFFKWQFKFQAVLFQRALAASGLSPEEIVGILSKVTSPKFTEDEITQLLRKALEKRSVNKEDIEAISKIQKALRNGKLGFGGNGDGDASKITDELKNLIAAGEVDLEILGKAILMQKILSVSGLSPEDLGKAILLQQGTIRDVIFGKLIFLKDSTAFVYGLQTL